MAGLVRAELLLQEEQPGAAVDLLVDLLKRYPQGLYLEPTLGARILLAMAHFKQHQVNHARQVMAEAVRLAYVEGFIRPFLDHGRSCAPLLMLVLHTSNLSSPVQAFVKQLLRLLANSDTVLKSLPEEELTALTTAASITAREQQVLRLVTTGLSNREIAAELSFAESTVKTHLKNIYRKLGVNNRMRAIAQARALKLA